MRTKAKERRDVATTMSMAGSEANSCTFSLFASTRSSMAPIALSNSVLSSCTCNDDNMANMATPYQVW